MRYPLYAPEPLILSAIKVAVGIYVPRTDFSMVWSMEVLEVAKLEVQNNRAINAEMRGRDDLRKYGSTGQCNGCGGAPLSKFAQHLATA